ncbi:MAG: leucine--tRNA ligase [Ardenticatenaceae bacterium]
MSSYNPKDIEPKWQARWAEEGVYETDMTSKDAEKNYYNLTMYPYPSGNLHTGHWYAYTGPDIYGRYKRMRGSNVFFPFGYDAFGLPAENAAIKRNIHPAIWTKSNIEYMTNQVKRIGAMIDWRAKLATCDPEYYKWNQWFFLKFMERGLAYREFAPVDWCPNCNTTLAREQVKGENRICERCDTPVIKKALNQWKLRITAYADQLLNDLDQLEWPERIKLMQSNWIGRSRGANIRFPVQGVESEQIEVFTTRPDTIFGATFMVLAPEHPLVARITTDEQREVVEAYQYNASRQTEIERQATDKEKSGVFTGGYAINPLNNEPIPIWIADYVLMGYGTGAIMAVPGGDQRDHDFAEKFGLPIVPVTVPIDGDESDVQGKAYANPGRMIHSGEFNGMITLAKYEREEWGEAQEREYGIQLGPDEAEAKVAITRIMEEKGIGEGAITYRMRDWLISRQRFWGTPIPVIHCEACGTVPVAYQDLPVELPMDVDFKPTGESPLKFHDSFRHTTCPQCGAPAERDTDTMDTFVDSSWYQYRYLSPDYDEGPFDPKAAEGWLAVDQYTGGAEHAVMHLLYSRFWTKVMRDMGLVDFDEPFPRLFNQGIILGPDSQKMSKSRGNVVDPDELVEQYGADTVRGYLMFIGPWDQGGPFSMTGIEGVRRFYGRVWGLMTSNPKAKGKARAKDIQGVERALHQTVERVQNAYDTFSFNVALAALMEYSNKLRAAQKKSVVNSPIWDQAMDALLIMLAPIAPHITEELWAQRGKPFSIHQQPWPEFDPEKAKEDMFELVIMFNGKVRDRVQAPVGINKEDAIAKAAQSERIQELLDGREAKRTIYVPGKLVNVVG